MAQSIESVTDPDTTETDSFAIAQGARVVVRNSAGIPYVVVENLTEDAICVYKGNATEPTSFAEKDDGNNPTGTIYGSCSAAIDSDDIIHIAYMLDDGKDSQLLYCTFDADAGGSTDTFAGVDTVIVDDLGEDPTAIANLQSAIAIDSNDKPHIAYVGNVKSGGDTNFTVSYVNKTGASWTASPVEVEGVTNTVDCKYPDICIDADDIPVISYLNDTDDTADYGYGNANDATSFTLGVLDATALSGSSTSVCVDSSGDHFFASVDADGTILGHWINSDWSSFGLVRDTGTTGSSPTIVADGTDVYVFYEDADNDIAYSKSTDNCVTWDPNGTALDEGTFNTVKAKWTFCVDNDSGGALVTAFTPGRIDTYSFDASLNTTPGTPDDPDSKWSSDDNAFDGSVDTDADASTIGSTSANFLLGKGTTAPSSGSATITKVRARIYSDNSASLAIARSPIYTEGLGQRLSSTDLVPYNASVGEDWGIYTTLNIPTGGWTWDKLSKLETKTYITSDTPGTASRIEIEVTRAAIYTRSSSSELDYVFLDETGSPDVQFNSLSLVAAGDDYYETPSDSLSISEALANKTTLSVSDSQSIAESPVVVNEFYRDLSDTLSISEALATDVAISLADTLAFAESLEKAVSLVLADGITFADSEIEEPVKFLTDSISIAESLAVVNEFYKDLSDVLPIAESLAGSTGLSLSDSLTIAEEPSFIRGVYIELADSIGMIESLAKDISAELTDSLSISESLSIGVVHSLSDSIGFAESLVRGVDLGLSEPLPIAESLANKSTLGLSDAITFAESLAHDEEYYRELADSQGIAESLALTVGKPLSDSLAINESISMKPGLGLADSQTFSEQITKIAVGLGLSDLLPISYSLANSHSLVLSDTLSVAESLAITNTFEREFSDSILITEEVDPVIIIKLNLDDSISIAESLVVRAGKGLTESLVIAESPATTSEFYLELSDSITFADSEIEITEKVLVDSQGFAESIEKTVVLGLGDSLSIADSEVEEAEKALVDSLNIAESIEKSIGFPLSDSLPISELLANSSSISLSDIILIVEGLATESEFYLDLSDSIALADSEVEAVGLELSDSLSISESLAFGQPIKLLTDSLSIAEQLANQTGLKILDGQSISEAAEKTIILVLSDSISFADSEIAEVEIELSDSQGIAEVIGKVVGLVLSDSVALIDSEVEKPVKALSDSISIIESLAINVGKGLTDSISISESLANTTTLRLSDSISISEGLAITWDAELDISDSQPISELLANSITLALSDLIPFVEEVDPQLGVEGDEYEKDLSDSLVIGEILAKSVTLDFSESLVIAESVANLTSISFSDVIGITEQISTKRIQLGLSDSILFADSSLEIWDIEKDLLDSLLISEALVKDFILVLSDSLSMADSELELVSLVLSDNILLTESITSAYFIVRTGDLAFIRSNIP